MIKAMLSSGKDAGFSSSRILSYFTNPDRQVNPARIYEIRDESIGKDIPSATERELNDFTSRFQKIPVDDPAGSKESLTAARETLGPGGPLEDIAIGPLADIEGKAVSIEELLALKTDEGVPQFSGEVQDLLRLARSTPRLECNGVSIVDAAAYLRAALLEGEKDRSGSGGRSHNSLVKALIARGLSLDALRDVGWPEKLKEQTSVPKEYQKGGLIDPHMSRILANAARFAKHTRSPNGRIFGRHAMAALIQSDEGRAVFANWQFVGDDAQAFFGAIHKAFLDHVRKVRLGKGEDLKLWERIVSDFPTDLPEWAKPREIQRFNPSYDTDETVALDNDRLGVGRDAEALADLICLKAAKPPLAVGLFGDWGAGKSTFMGMLEEAIDRATRDDAHTPDLFV